MADDIGGVWRTIGGRRVFIKTGQSLSSAMRASGKFKRLKRDYDPDEEEAKTIQSVSKLVQLEMNDTGNESVDQFVNRLVGKNVKGVEAKRAELNKRLEHASEEYSKYAKSLNYTEKFRDEFEYWDRERKLYRELVHNYDEIHKKKTKATNAPLF